MSALIYYPRKELFYVVLSLGPLVLGVVWKWKDSGKKENLCFSGGVTELCSRL